jgi:hypothetical protein
MTGINRLENHRGGVGKFRLGCHGEKYTYVACYLTRRE